MFRLRFVGSIWQGGRCDRPDARGQAEESFLHALVRDLPFLSIFLQFDSNFTSFYSSFARFYSVSTSIVRWVVGLAAMVTGAILDFGSLVFAAQSLLAPLAGAIFY